MYDQGTNTTRVQTTGTLDIEEVYEMPFNEKNRNKRVVYFPMLSTIIILTIIILYVYSFSLVHATEFQTYSNPTLDFSLDYPSDWIVSASEDRVYFSPPNLQGFQQAELSISVEKLSDRSPELSNASLQVYTNFTLDNDILPYHENVTQLTNVTMGDMIAHGVSYTETNVGAPDLIDTNLNIWTIRNGLVYNLDFFSQQVDYSSLAPLIKRMIDSFSF